MIAKLLEFFARYTKRPDKVLHALAGLLVFALAAGLGASSGAALAWVVVVGLGKEVYDWRHPERQTADIWDAWATIAPAVLLWLLIDFAPGGLPWLHRGVVG